MFEFKKVLNWFSHLIKVRFVFCPNRTSVEANTVTPVLYLLLYLGVAHAHYECLHP